MGTAHRSIVAVSDSSTMKVDWPAMMWSRAPMRTKQASIGDRVSSSAGTHAPTCPQRTAPVSHMHSLAASAERFPCLRWRARQAGGQAGRQAGRQAGMEAGGGGGGVPAP